MPSKEDYQASIQRNLTAEDAEETARRETTRRETIRLEEQRKQNLDQEELDRQTSDNEWKKAMEQLGIQNGAQALSDLIGGGPVNVKEVSGGSRYSFVFGQREGIPVISCKEGKKVIGEIPIDRSEWNPATTILIYNNIPITGPKQTLIDTFDFDIGSNYDNGYKLEPFVCAWLVWEKEKGLFCTSNRTHLGEFSHLYNSNDNPEYNCEFKKADPIDVQLRMLSGFFTKCYQYLDKLKRGEDVHLDFGVPPEEHKFHF